MHAPASIDPKEVAYYERLAHTWRDRSGPFWPLHRLNELRVACIRDYLCRHFARDPGAPEPLSGLRMLDIGRGGHPQRGHGGAEMEEGFSRTHPNQPSSRYPSPKRVP